MFFPFSDISRKPFSSSFLSFFFFFFFFLFLLSDNKNVTSLYFFWFFFFFYFNFNFFFYHHWMKRKSFHTNKAPPQYLVSINSIPIPLDVSTFIFLFCFVFSLELWVQFSDISCVFFNKFIQETCGAHTLILVWKYANNIQVLDGSISYVRTGSLGVFRFFNIFSSPARLHQAWSISMPVDILVFVKWFPIETVFCVLGAAATNQYAWPVYVNRFEMLTFSFLFVCVCIYLLFNLCYRPWNISTHDLVVLFLFVYWDQDGRESVLYC